MSFAVLFRVQEWQNYERYISKEKEITSKTVSPISKRISICPFHFRSQRSKPCEITEYFLNFLSCWYKCLNLETTPSCMTVVFWSFIRSNEKKVFYKVTHTHTCLCICVCVCVCVCERERERERERVNLRGILIIPYGRRLYWKINIFVE